MPAELEEYVDILTALGRGTAIYDHPAAQRLTLQRASEQLAIFDGGVFILDTFGSVVAADPERPDVLGQNWSDRPYFRYLLRDSGPVFSDILNDGPDRTPAVLIAVPVVGFQDEFLGVLIGMFRLGATTSSPLYGDIVKMRLGESGSVYLVDSTGRVIYHSDVERIGEDFSTQAVVQQALSGQVRAIRTLDFEGREIVVGFAPVPGLTSWGLVTEETWEALTRSSRGYGRYLLLLLALGVLVPAIMVAIGVRRITRPITELISAAQAVAGAHSMGNYVLRNALQSYLRLGLSPTLQPLFKHIFLVAADEDHDAFEHEHKLKRLPELGDQVHCYFNRGDTALAITDKTKQNPTRLGNRGPQVPHAAPGNVNLVDTSEVLEGIIEHSYFVESERVVADVAEVLRGVAADQVAGRRYVAAQNPYVLE